MSRLAKSGPLGGFTLVEVMVAMTLGLLVIASLVGIFSNSSRTFREDQKLASVDDELTSAMAQITEDIEMAGFFGAKATDPCSIFPDDGTAGTGCNRGGAPTGSLSVTADCGPAAAGKTWTYDRLKYPISVQNNVAAATSTVFPCITDAYTGTASNRPDIIAIKRVVGSCTRTFDGTTIKDCVADPTGAGGGTAIGAGTGLTNYRIYLRTNGANAVLFRPTSGSSDPADAALSVPATVSNPYSDWEYRVSIYYIRNYSVTDGDGIPSLCRKYLAGGDGSTAPHYDTECFAQGIESLQIEYGLDTQDATGTAVTPPKSGDGVADVYVSNPSCTQRAQIVSARIWLLARSVDLVPAAGGPENLLGQNASYTNAKTYTASDGVNAYAPADNRYRKLMSGVVVLRNPINLSSLYTTTQACP